MELVTIMTTLHINSAIELEQVLQGVDSLDTPELERFLAQVGTLLARRKAPSIPQREAVLLQQINRPLLPQPQQIQYQQLSQKLHTDNIAPSEYDALLNLVDMLEQADAERMQSLLELAQLRNLPLDILMQQLGIQTPKPHV